MRQLEYPFTAESVAALKTGEHVCLSGRVFTGRDRLHEYLFEGGISPVALADGAIYHCGPVVLHRDGAWRMRSAGPTTSRRQEPYMPEIIRAHGLRMIIGKGGMGEGTRRACREHGCVYVQVVGGAGALLAERVQAVTGVHFLSEFGAADALWELVVSGFEGVVTMDTQGRSLHRRVQQASLRRYRDLWADDAPAVRP